MAYPKDTTLSDVYFLCVCVRVCLFRICHCEGDSECPLIMPCRCTGSLSFVHQACLNQWIKSSDTRCCELCKFDFVMETKLKPLRKVGPGSESSLRVRSATGVVCGRLPPSRVLPLIVSPLSSLCPAVGEAPHVKEREEEDLLLSDVSRNSNSVYVVVSLRSGQENGGGDQTWEERSVYPPPHPLTPCITHQRLTF